MKSIKSTGYKVYFEGRAYEALNEYLESHSHSKLFVLVDSNTAVHCLPLFLEKTKLEDRVSIIEIPAGEKFKNLETCNQLWESLSSEGGDRKSLLINLGGGVITDMGGFVASCFKRGIRFINAPTTLLSMVDASVGGKTGVDLGALKNQVGVFCNPEMVMIDVDYLRSVSEREIKSGLAEIIKYGYTFDKELLEEILDYDSVDLERVFPLVHRSVEIKNEVVLYDMHESGIRKTLNFGHTIGHAIESYFLESADKEDLTHGEAIAMGMIIELYYSTKICGLDMKYCQELKSFVRRFYGDIPLENADFEPIVALLIYDKKNVGGKINFVLVDELEHCVLDQQLSRELIEEGLNFYLKD